MRKSLAVAVSTALVGSLALAAGGDRAPGLQGALATEVLANVSAVKQVLADPITTGGLFVNNLSNTLVLGIFPVNNPVAGLAASSGALVWGSSAGADTPAGVKGALAVADDNSGKIAVSNSFNTVTVEIGGNTGLRTVNGDLAETFPSQAPAEPGSVMAIDPARPGGVALASRPYDRRVAGVVSGARDYRPGVTLRGLAGIQGVTLTLSGTVYCLVSDVNGPVRAGDLLTSSAVPGHAMRATDFDRAHGAILGKAMEDLQGSRGHVLMLAGLQ